jgi:hypothetical protein
MAKASLCRISNQAPPPPFLPGSQMAFVYFAVHPPLSAQLSHMLSAQLSYMLSAQLST